MGPFFFVQGSPDYGTLQTRALVPAANAVPLRQRMSFNEASLLPMAVTTAWSGWYSIDVPGETAYTATDKKGMLVWGGASSIGSAAVQVAKLIGFTVYSTASEKHHEYLKGLGASKVFDYRDENVVRSIVKAANEDGVTVQTGFDAVGQLKECMEFLKKLKGEAMAKLASAIPLFIDPPAIDGVKVKFVTAPQDQKQRMEFFHFVFGVWLKERLEKGEFVPSSKISGGRGRLEVRRKRHWTYSRKVLAG